jgi:hypothetical protein
MKTQTAIEWFQSQIINIVNGDCELSEIEIFEQANAMFEKQIKDAYKFGLSDEYVIGSERYYNETFKSE